MTTWSHIINRNVECAFQCSEAPLSLHPLFDGWQVRKATQHWKARSTLRFLFSKTRFRQIFRHTPVDFYVLPPDLKTAFGNVAQDENYKWRRRDTTTGTTNDDKRWQGDDDRRHTTTATHWINILSVSSETSFANSFWFGSHAICTFSFDGLSYSSSLSFCNHV